MNSNIDLKVSEIRFNQRLKQMGLTFVADFVKKNNPNLNAYHNTAHMLGVARIAVELWDVENVLDDGQYSLEHLIVACLFHDYDHSGGTQTDAENIEDALLGIEQMLTGNECEKEELFYQILQNDFVDRVKALIRVTEFPFVRTPVYLAEKIIRDADILYTFQSRTGGIVEGLFLELKQCGKLPAGMKLKEFLQGQETFLEGIEMFTTVGDTIKKQMTYSVIQAQREWNHHIEETTRIARPISWGI